MDADPKGYIIREMRQSNRITQSRMTDGEVFHDALTDQPQLLMLDPNRQSKRPDQLILDASSSGSEGFHDALEEIQR